MVLDSELAHSLCSSKSGFEPCFSAIEIVLGLVENFLSLEDIQNPFLPCKNFFGEEEFR